MSPDGAHAVSGSEDGELRVFSLDPPAQLEAFVLPGDSPRSVAFAADGHSFFVGTERSVIFRHALESKR